MRERNEFVGRTVLKATGMATTSLISVAGVGAAHGDETDEDDESYFQGFRHGYYSQKHTDEKVHKKGYKDGKKQCREREGNDTYFAGFYDSYHGKEKRKRHGDGYHEATATGRRKLTTTTMRMTTSSRTSGASGMATTARKNKNGVRIMRAIGRAMTTV